MNIKEPGEVKTQGRRRRIYSKFSSSLSLSGRLETTTATSSKEAPLFPPRELLLSSFSWRREGEGPREGGMSERCQKFVGEGGREGKLFHCSFHCSPPPPFLASSERGGEGEEVGSIAFVSVRERLK